jgi:predicted N-acetyltransferase YhbS
MPEITLRDATEGDIPAIVAITQAAFGEYEGLLDPPSSVRDETPEKVRAKLREGVTVLALHDDVPVGAVYFSPRGEYAYMGRLSVLPAQRGQGIGAALVAHVEERARALGLAYMELGVRVALPHLIAMYTRLGYHIAEERRHPGYSVTTFVMMHKRLDGGA